MNKFKLSGEFKLRHFRGCKLLKEHVFKNGITTVGLNKILGVMFNAQTQITPWYFGLIDNASFSALAAADTMASHAGWIENQDYDEAARPTWVEDTPASGIITNTATVDFTMNATKTIKGIFINSVNTKGGTLGTLWSTASLPATVSVVDDDVLKFIYTLTAS